MKIRIIFASSYGFSEGVARVLAGKLRRSFPDTEHDTIETTDANAVTDLSTLQSYEFVFLILSTFGNGEAPMNGSDFLPLLIPSSGTPLEGVRYSVLAVGSSQFPEFCRFGKQVDEYFSNLGGKRVLPACCVDNSCLQTVREWTSSLFTSLDWKGMDDQSLAYGDPVDESHYEFFKLIQRDVLVEKNGEYGVSKVIHWTIEAAHDLAYTCGDILLVRVVDVQDKNAHYFSICSCPEYLGESKRVEIAFKVNEDGVMTSTMQYMQVGAVVHCALLRSPVFRLPEVEEHHERPIVLIGTGTGIAPLRAIIQERVFHSCIGGTHLFYGSKTEASIVFGDELKKWHEGGFIDFHAIQSQENEKERIQILLKRHGKKIWDLLKKKNAIVFVCGGSAILRSIDESMDAIGKEEEGPDFMWEPEKKEMMGKKIWRSETW
jgi:sulfite reductase (NADPH) flavoprotein alpha-component